MPLPSNLQSSAEKLVESLMVVSLYLTSCFSLADLKFLPLSLPFDDLILMCLGVGLVGLISFATLWASWVYISISQVRKFSAIISTNKFSAPFSPYSPYGISII